MTDVTDNNVVPIKKNKRGRFGKPGVENPGRPRNSTNKNTRLLKEAIMIAAEIEGQDGQGKGKLIGFLRRVAQEDIRSFVSLLRSIIPLQVIEERSNDKAPQTTVYKSLDEVKRELASRGISMDIMMKLSQAERLADEDEDEDDNGGLPA